MLILIFLFKKVISWHITCFQNSCQIYDSFEKIINIIPKEINPDHKQSENDFTRNRALPFAKTVALTLSITANGSNQGVDTQCGQFFKNVRRCGLWPDANAVHRSSVTKARKKIPWQAFQDILSDSVELAYSLEIEDNQQFLWHGMPVFATDGSRFNLPATEAIREHFDPDSGLDTNGKGHYPQCLVTTVYDVFRRLPIARSVVANDGSERDELKNLLPAIPSGGILTFDRGYPSYEIIHFLNNNYSGHWLFRCPSSSTFKAVEKFVESGKEEDIVYITATNNIKRKFGINERKNLKPIKVRVIRLESPDGTVSVLLTNLFGKNRYTAIEITDLYFKRWRVEEYYRDEKVVFEIEKFHSTSVNGVLQELYSAMIVSVISRCMMLLSSQFFLPDNREPQFKNAVLSIAAEAAILVPDDPVLAIQIFKELLVEIARVKYYRPINKRPSQPRINKGPKSKWHDGKRKKASPPNA
ncbi:conserved hypothetical protein [Desulfamplus magnetovallimortis]|uniref:Transposase IS4-like domain-containing protein n=2 Tax=Desulfamplus magnetovallimortis TaxID=1246637 RepID=A0A1W1HFK8_9BACT|nr:conserved hypothetical protein [Desulfamplus magnetovallimortis]